MQSRHKKFHRWIASFGLLYGLVVIIVSSSQLIVPRESHGHVVPEKIWHPVAGGYLRALFYLNLQPIDWKLIAAEFAAYEEPSHGVHSIYEALATANTKNTDHKEKIRAAIKDRDAHELYLSSTMAVSQLIRHHLETAKTSLNTPANARNSLEKAQALYRALAHNWLEQFDPSAFVYLGRQWLQLSTSIGTDGIGAISDSKSKITIFEAAQQKINEYLVANYETNTLPPLIWYAPTPATVVLANNNSFRPRPSLPPGSNTNDQVPLPRLVLNFEEHDIEESDLFLVAYGDMLFDSPEIFGSPASELNISCSICHNRGDINREFFIPGISARPGGVDVDGHFFNPKFNDRRSDPLDTPSLRGIRFTGPYGRDGRFGSLRDFVRNVIVNEFAGTEPTPLMLDALVAYLFEFDWLPNPRLKRDGSLAADASPAAQRGEILFNQPFAKMGQMSCATCHDPSANFKDTKRHDIGTGNPSSHGAFDSAFETPTLLNINFTAPYMHDGSLKNLDAVINWFNQRFSLELTSQQKSDLLEYLKTVGDGVAPYEQFDEQNTLFQLFWEELSTFVTTLDVLLPAQDAFHADLLINTVAPDLRADAMALEDTRQIPLVYELAEILDTIQNSYQNGNWSSAIQHWKQWQQLADEYGPKFR